MHFYSAITNVVTSDAVAAMSDILDQIEKVRGREGRGKGGLAPRS